MNFKNIQTKRNEVCRIKKKKSYIFISKFYIMEIVTLRTHQFKFILFSLPILRISLLYNLVPLPVIISIFKKVARENLMNSTMPL